MAGTSKGAVTAAVAGNGLLTVAKFGAFLASGSGAMLSEAIHSLADTSNQVLLLMGITKSERPADTLFHYGYGAERFLYALLSAVGIFVLGCGVTMYHGVHLLMDPHEIKIGWLTWAVLGLAFVIEGWVLLKAYKVVWAAKGDESLREYLRSATDPSAIAVLAEDAVALLGVLIAAAGITLSQITGNVIWDAVGTIMIGGLLGLIAIWLGLKNRELLLGRALPAEEHRRVEEFLAEQDSVLTLGDVRSRLLGAESYRLKADLEFDGTPLGVALSDWVRDNLPDADDPEAVERFSGEFGARVVEALGDEVDRIEEEMNRRFPGLGHVDLEAD